LTFVGDNRAASASRVLIRAEGAIPERRIRSDEVDLIGRIATPHLFDLIWELRHGTLPLG
jgi:hypothetical protein